MRNCATPRGCSSMSPPPAPAAGDYGHPARPSTAQDESTATQPAITHGRFARPTGTLYALLAGHTPTTDDRPFFFTRRRWATSLDTTPGRSMLFGNGLSAC
jgi:hypothetical protein